MLRQIYQVAGRLVNGSERYNNELIKAQEARSVGESIRDFEALMHVRIR